VKIRKGEAELFNQRGLVGIGEVTAASVELDDIRQRRLATVVEEGALQPNVAQTRRLEGAPIVPRNAPGHTLRAGTPAAEVLGCRAYAGVVEALVAAVVVHRAVQGKEADGRVGHLRAGVARGAVALTGREDAHTRLLVAGQRRGIAGEEAVHRSLIGDQCAHVRLDRLPPEGGEVTRLVR